jgi:hypothetical protein
VGRSVIDPRWLKDWQILRQRRRRGEAINHNLHIIAGLWNLETHRPLRVNAAIASAVGAVLSFIGLIHAPQVEWAANPQVALGYLFFGLVCVGTRSYPARRTRSRSTRPISSPGTDRG